MKQHFLFRLRALAALMLCACVFLLPVSAGNAEDPSQFIVDDSMEEQSLAERAIARMTLHEKVCQLFFVQPEQFSRLESVNAYSKKLGEAFQRFPVGGVILFEQHITKKNLASLNAGLIAVINSRSADKCHLNNDCFAHHTRYYILTSCIRA